MITGKDIYELFSALVPLYVAMVLAYGSVRWWNVLTPDQCSGINRFVAVFAIPFLSFHFISSNDFYAMNLRFIAADSLQKLVILVALFLWQCLSKHSDLGWTITLFSLSTLPNTLVLGIPLLNAMYGDFSGSLMVQIVVVQSMIWYTLLLFLFEYRGAKALLFEQVPPELARDITSFRVDSNVSSLGGSEPIQAETEVGQDGKIQMVLKRSASHRVTSIASTDFRESLSLRGMELHALQSASPAEATPEAFEVKKTDFYSVSFNKVTSPRTGGYDNGCDGSKSTELMNRGVCSNYTPHHPALNRAHPHALACGSLKEGGANKGLNMSVQRSSSSPILKGNRRGRVASVDFDAISSRESPDQQMTTALAGSHACSEAANSTRNERTSGETHMNDGSKSSSRKTPFAGPNLLAQNNDADVETGEQRDGNRGGLPSGVMTMLVLIMVWRKLVRNPNTYAGILGLAWSLVSFRWNIELPKMVKGSISIISDAGIGMSMFSLGLFMALQPNIIACGKSVAAFAMAARFLMGPAVTAATSVAIGIRGDLLRVTIVQAALPGGIVPFVFAKEYHCLPDVVSTSVVFGMLIALPVTFVYYFLLGL